MFASPDRNTGQIDDIMPAGKYYEIIDNGNILAEDTNRSELQHIKFQEYLLSCAP
jgi:hypothetical protein